MNATIGRFGWPQTLVAEYAHWLVLLRPEAVTLGSLVLAAKGAATAYADLPAEAFAEQADAVRDIEAALATAVRWERINYLMLMMVDPHVHFHVIPRYQGTREHDGLQIADHGWPKLPELGRAITLDPDRRDAQVAWLKGCWPNGRTIART
jgi:diadenosine tetraphosphate (Ap4A) HIT family hydrolase